MFDFAKDYLGLLKAAVIASGVIPPGIEGSGQSLADLLTRIVGPSRGLEIVSNVNNIPKGSRLAVSTNLLAALISVCMRATGQAESLTGPLQESERRHIARELHDEIGQTLTVAEMNLQAALRSPVAAPLEGPLADEGHQVQPVDGDIDPSLLPDLADSALRRRLAGVHVELPADGGAEAYALLVKEEGERR